MIRFYKGLTSDGYARFLASRRPGFCGPRDRAIIYADPSLVGEEDDVTYLISFEAAGPFIHQSDIGDSCLIEPSEHPHLYCSNWTAKSSLSDDPVPYHGEEVREWRLEATIHGTSEWQALWATSDRYQQRQKERLA